MVKKVKEAEGNDVEQIDLIAMLSLPGTIDNYSIELIEPTEEIDLIALGKEEIAAAKSSSDKQQSNTSSQSIGTISPRLNAKPSANIATPLSSSSSASKSATRPITSRIPNPITPIPNDSFEKIITDISNCKSCGLCQTRKNVVPGVGNQHAKLVLIGEAPGADEDTQGIPFVGKAGQHLDKILAAAGFKKEDLYICNILKCRPPNNRDPKLDEMTVCTPFLQRQLALIKPRMIACLGNIAAHYVIGPTVPGISRIHGQWFQSIFGIPTFAMYHPSYLIRSESREKGSPNWQTWQDIRVLKAKYDTLKS